MCRRSWSLGGGEGKACAKEKAPPPVSQRASHPRLAQTATAQRRPRTSNKHDSRTAHPGREREEDASSGRGTAPAPRPTRISGPQQDNNGQTHTWTKGDASRTVRRKRHRHHRGFQMLQSPRSRVLLDRLAPSPGAGPRGRWAAEHGPGHARRHEGRERRRRTGVGSGAAPAPAAAAARRVPRRAGAFLC